MAVKRKKKPLISPFYGNTVTIQNGSRLVMENVERIVFCQKEKIILKGRLRLEISGENLSLEELGNDNLAVRGKIRSLLFGEEEK